MFVSEKKLVDAFIQNHIYRSNLITECDFRWGNIDVVKYDLNNEVYLSPNQSKALKDKNNLLVFSSLYRNRGLRIGTICTKTGFDELKVLKIINKLVALGIVVEEVYTYRIDHKINFPDIVVYAYEMKLSDIRKAINQAVINRSYCDYSYIVFPMDKLSLCMKYEKLLNSTGVGLVLVDETANKIFIQAKRVYRHRVESLNSKIRLLDIRTSESNSPHVASKSMF